MSLLHDLGGISSIGVTVSIPSPPVWSCVLMMWGNMPRRPDVATSLCIVSNAKQDLSYFCM